MTSIDITDPELDIGQLSSVRKQLEDEHNHLANSFAQLKQAQAKFNTCGHNITGISLKNKDKPILVPLTSSLYVSGRLSNTDLVVVDIGTGYYVQMTHPQAKEYYADKEKYISDNVATLQETLEKKRENLQFVISLIQDKMQAQAQPATEA